MKYQLILFEKNQNNLSRTLLFENLVVKCTKKSNKNAIIFYHQQVTNQTWRQCRVSQGDTLPTSPPSVPTATRDSRFRRCPQLRSTTEKFWNPENFSGFFFLVICFRWAFLSSQIRLFVVMHSRFKSLFKLYCLLLVW